MKINMKCVIVSFFEFVMLGSAFIISPGDLNKVNKESKAISGASLRTNVGLGKSIEESISWADAKKDDGNFTNDDICNMTMLPPTGRFRQCCGIDASSVNKIVGGNETKLRQYPWTVLLEYKDTDGEINTYCGGILISGGFVLTAAHCIKGMTAPTSVRLGEYDTAGPSCVYDDEDELDCTDGPVSIPIEEIKLHPAFNIQTTGQGEAWNDIALIKLKRIANYSDHIRPICLPNTDINEDYERGLRLYSAGWGYMLQRNNIPGLWSNHETNIKRHVDLPYVPLKVCKEVWGGATSTKVCAGGEKGKDVCNGDSGGPLMREIDGVYYLVGIVSYGASTPCGQRDVPGAYTNVYSYLGWVYENMLNYQNKQQKKRHRYHHRG